VSFGTLSRTGRRLNGTANVQIMQLEEADANVLGLIYLMSPKSGLGHNFQSVFLNIPSSTY
jgi:hypothetical protein